jgi:polar amino acid transport system substrate-binding protein
VAVLMTLPALATEPPVLQLGSDSWPPFTDAVIGQRVALDLVHTALERAGIEAATSIVDWKEVERGLRAGRFDGSAAIWRSKEREKNLLYSEPYLENRLILVGRKGSDVSARQMSELAGKRVGAVSLYAYGKAIENSTGVVFVGGRNDQENLDKLLSGEVDYILVDALVVRYLMTNQYEEAAARLEIGKHTLARRQLHLALRRDVEGAEEIIAAFNEQIRAMLTDGTFGRILQVGWIRFDVDGDGLAELVAIGDAVGATPPGSVYDVFGEAPVDLPPEQQRVFIQGSIFEGWNAIPERYKVEGPADPNQPAYKQGTTVFTLQF